MTTTLHHRYLRLPLDADQGFPQAVRISLGGRIYLLSAHVNVTDETLLAQPKPLALPSPGAFLALAVTTEEAGRTRVLFRRKLVPDLEYQARELALVFTELAVHPLNINGSGAHGSSVVGGVALRWAS
ncbi:hypothetical protein NDR87_03245 [Nocardia sp. CDC159]|uniref:Uncharacterized protein n=1 Tax=Nocardia pulmonis TaxID=2951408 RepID=A0A9X2IVN0_9NOCA|nr:MULTISPECIES: hypothetical protein [Nocardia]MCM6771970.1 hypothetical protein [Nocardia pulmonis]MCM6785372.1 hypothetical protein [Nocardia sp. CDC159]